MIRETYHKSSWKPEDIGWLYCHQAGAGPYRQMTKLAEIDMRKMPVTYRKFGILPVLQYL